MQCLFSCRLGFGLYGAAWAAVSIQSSLVVLLLGYLVFSECVRRSKRAAKGWEGLQLLEVVQGWWGYLEYGLPCVLMVCLEVSEAWLVLEQYPWVVCWLWPEP
jgi:hypothetical protein